MIKKKKSKSHSGASEYIYCQVSFSEQPLAVLHLHARGRQGSSAGCGHHTGTDVTPGLCDLCCWGDLLVSKQHACLMADGPCRCCTMCVYVCMCRKAPVSGECTCFCSWLMYLCARAFVSILYIGYLKWNTAAEPDDSRTWWRIREKHYTDLIEPVWKWCSYIRKQWSIYVLLLPPPPNPSRQWWYSWLSYCYQESLGNPFCRPSTPRTHTHIHTDTTLISLSLSLMERIQLSSSGKKKKNV